MTEANTIIATIIAQAAGANLLSIVLLSFHRYYRRSYLLHWTWSWWALTMYLICGAISLYLSPTFAASHPFRILLSLISQVTAYWQVAWLLFGSYEVSYARDVPRKLVRQILVVSAFLGIVSVFLFLNETGFSTARYFVRVGIRAFITGIAFLVAAAGVWRRTGSGKLGPRIVCVAFIAHGLEQIQTFTVIALRATGSPPIGFSVYLEFFDLVVLFVTGLGMVIWFLEVERERVVRASEQIEHLAYHDSLTRLPNRRLFMDRLQLTLAQANRIGKSVCILFLDLDRFKDINDSLGHTFGDELLRAVAERIRTVLREGDTVARLGGDEFTVLIPEASREEAASVAAKLMGTLREPFHIHDHELFVSTSVGVSIYPDDGRDAETLVKNSDNAMYRAKDMGRNNCQFYAPAMNARALERLALENGLRKAAGNHEFILHYQPVVDLRSRETWGVEALIRWNHPDRGILMPGDFLYLAEVCGIMDEMNRWVLETACEQLSRWHNRFDPGLEMAVNLSAPFFQHPGLVSEIHRVLKHFGLRTDCLTLEITETTAMQNAEASLAVLRELKTLGVMIAIDDFGTGYSSLSYLRTFPIDILKIDRSFVRDIGTDPEDAAIAAAVITLAHGLKIHVVGEGVETEEQLRVLGENGCDRFQGYLYSKPLPAVDLEALLSSRPNNSAFQSPPPLHG